MPVVECVQGTSEWFQVRAGKVTASEVADAIAFLSRKSKNGEAGEETAARAKYKARLVAETLSGAPDMEGYLSQCMKDGTENEPLARAAYEERYDVLVDTVGFVTHPTIERAGASPDGFVGDDGGVEIKCPKTATHIGYMRDGGIPEEYEPQIMFNLACSGRKWWDFVSYDGRLPRRHRMFVRRVFRDEERIKQIEDGVIQFLAEADAVIAELNRLNPEIEDRPILEKFIDPELMITDSDLPKWWREAQ